jgi:hypothetical protein
VLSGALGFRLGDAELVAGPGAAVLARHGTPHTYWNAGDTKAEYPLVMPRRIAKLVEALHRPHVDPRAIFVAHASEVLAP